MKTIISLIITLAMASTLYAAQKSGCTLAQKGKVTVAFKAYKTPSKIGVSGTFSKVAYTPVAKDGKNFREILVGSSVVVDAKSVNSKNEGRDAKLVKFFFEQMSGDIKAKITDIKADKHIKGKPRTGVVSIEVTMNNVKKIVPMKYNFSEGVFSAGGTIDILDFSASNALHSINKACYDLHKGKTWSDVEIAFTTKIEATLCHVKPLK